VARVGGVPDPVVSDLVPGGVLRAAAVPAQDGTWGDQPVHSQSRGQEPDQRGQDRAVCPAEPGPRIGPAQHSDLVAQYEQFGVL
jgi:hypothetical protein